MHIKTTSIIIVFFLLVSCDSKKKMSNKLTLKYDSINGKYAYFDSRGDKVLGDFYNAFTDTISEYGIIADPGFVLIDKTGKHIYDIYPFDNGPDYTSEGIYRIIKNGKIGYVDSLSSKMIIEPKFECAYPFENGKAKVSYKCETVKEFPGDEHSRWESENWFYIDRKGNIVK